ncbi:L-xylo-3-hexulose reductase [Golovinomyces cichoracearum]|uniref:L-xylo-3-hexulose reductase n=1 Tax=Golovinomyces cichoracearum TaxID=62708 RepID=A0A420HMB6_9PEZI|nr:L-xylo-3-hexulose reductase [Golovinomyces cichoracearum]
MTKSSVTSATYRTLEGKVALVTGSSRGIGSGIARNLASKGASLILNYTSTLSTQICNDLASELREKFGGKHIVVQADMGSLEGPNRLVETAASMIPNLQLDIIVNNAGTVRKGKIEESTIEDFEECYAVNVRGPLLLMKAALPYLPNDRSGRIINVSSVAATCGIEGHSVYGGSKAALDAMTRSWARELSARATVNSINPGPVMTDMWENLPEAEMKGDIQAFMSLVPLGKIREGIDDKRISKETMGLRPAYVEEIAGIVGMLASAESGWCTGQVICANGGLRMSI